MPFATSTLKRAPLFFYSIGDWGGFTHSHRQTMQRVANQINQAVLQNQNGTQLMITLGDNFYNKGVSSTYDPLWNTTWYDVFVRPYPAMREIEWMALLGNHDYNNGMRGVAAQINQTWNKSNKWVMPSNNYYYTYEELGAHFIHVDTCEIYPELYEETNNVIHASATSKALNFVERCLETARKDNAKWIFVFGHYHIYSNGFCGNYDIMGKRLGRLLDKYKVDVYFSGHEHNFQHFERKGVKYVINGAAALHSSPLRQRNTDEEVDTVYNTRSHGFCEHMLSARRFVTRYINTEGEIEHEFQIIKR